MTAEEIVSTITKRYRKWLTEPPDVERFDDIRFLLCEKYRGNLCKGCPVSLTVGVPGCHSTRFFDLRYSLIEYRKSEDKRWLKTFCRILLEDMKFLKSLKYKKRRARLNKHRVRLGEK